MPKKVPVRTPPPQHIAKKNVSVEYQFLKKLWLRSRWGERGGSVVECRTPEREVGGSKPIAAVLCPWARHFTPRKYWLITQEAMAPSRHDWKIIDWDVKPQHKQTKDRDEQNLLGKWKVNKQSIIYSIFFMMFLNKHSIIYSIFLIMFHKTGKNRVQTTVHRTVLLEINKKKCWYKIFEPPHDKTNKVACAPSEDSDQTLIGSTRTQNSEDWIFAIMVIDFYNPSKIDNKPVLKHIASRINMEHWDYTNVWMQFYLPFFLYR